MNYVNSHFSIVEHQIDTLELFHDSYSFEEFKRHQLPNLKKELLKFYKKELKFAENYKPLAYDFFEHINYSKDVKYEIRVEYN